MDLDGAIVAQRGVEGEKDEQPSLSLPMHSAHDFRGRGTHAPKMPKLPLAVQPSRKDQIDDFCFADVL